MWSLEILSRSVWEKGPDQIRYRPVCIDDDEGFATEREEASDRSSEAGEVDHVTTVNELYAGHQTAYETRTENKWVGPFQSGAPKASAAIRSVLDQQLLVIWVERDVWLDSSSNHLDTRAPEQSF